MAAAKVGSTQIVDRHTLVVEELLGCELAVGTLDPLDGHGHRLTGPLGTSEILLLDPHRVVDDLPPHPIDQTRVEIMLHPGRDAVRDEPLFSRLVPGWSVVDAFLLGDAEAVRLPLGKELEDVGIDPVDVVTDLFYVTWV